MFFQGLLSSPLPYLLITIIYLIGLIPCALQKFGITKLEVETKTECSKQEDITDDCCCTFTEEFKNLAPIITEKIHAKTFYNAINQHILQKQIVSSVENDFKLPEQTAFLKSYFRAVIVSRPPPSA